MLIDLALRTGISTDAITPNSNLPSMQADLLVDWGFNINPDTGYSAESPVVELNNIGLDLGEFVSKALEPVIDMLDDYLRPSSRCWTSSTRRSPSSPRWPNSWASAIPLIDAIGRSAAAAGPAARRRAHRHHRPPADIQAIADAGSVVIPLGDIKFGKGEARPSRKKNTFSGQHRRPHPEKFADAQDIDQAGQAAKDFIDGLTGNKGERGARPRPAAFGSVETALGTFSIPLFQSPIKIVDLLFGKDVDLVTWDIPRLEAKFEFSQLFGPIIPRSPCSRRSAAGSGSSATCTWAWTPRGIRTGDFFKGVYFEHPRGPGRRPESPGWASPWSSRPALSSPSRSPRPASRAASRPRSPPAGTTPTTTARSTSTSWRRTSPTACSAWLRPGRQTRRLHRRTLNIEIRWASPALRSSTSASTSSRAIFDFSYTCPPLPAPVPGTNDNGTLRLNIGDRAPASAQPGGTDGDETVKSSARWTATATAPSRAPRTSTATGRSPRRKWATTSTATASSRTACSHCPASASSRSSAAAAAGHHLHRRQRRREKDSITLDKSVRVAATINGGAGDDTIVGGSAGDTLSGGEGDTITGSARSDTITGGGNDKLAGNAGANTVKGEDSDDQLFGGSNDGDEGARPPAPPPTTTSATPSRAALRAATRSMATSAATTSPAARAPTPSPAATATTPSTAAPTAT